MSTQIGPEKSNRNRRWWMLLLALLLLGLLGSGAGVLLGWLAQYGLMYLLSDLLPGTPASTGWQPVFNGFATGMVILIGFALPPLVSLRSVPPLRVLRRDLVPMPPASWLIYALAASVIELKVNLDWFNKTGGALLHPSLLFAGLVALVFFPGRIVARTIANTYTLLKDID